MVHATQKTIYKPVQLETVERGYLPDGKYAVYSGKSFLGYVRIERLGRAQFSACGIRG